MAMLQRLLTVPMLVVGLVAQDLGPEIDRIAHGQQFSGAILVARGGKSLHSKAYGYAVREWKVANTPETRFEIASITKTFTALAILQLVEQGKRKLSDRAAIYYPTAPATWNKITIEHSLRHRSGIPPHQKSTDYRKTITQPYTPAELVAEFHHAPLAFQPGTKFRYSNPGYHLLGLILERISGESYEDYSTTAYPRTCRHENTGIDRYQDIVPNRAEGYEQPGPQAQRAVYWDRSIAFATGSLDSTTEDLLRYDRALYEGKLLTEASIGAMITRSKVPRDWDGLSAPRKPGLATNTPAATQGLQASFADTRTAAS